MSQKIEIDKQKSILKPKQGENNIMSFSKEKCLFYLLYSLLELHLNLLMSIEDTTEICKMCSAATSPKKRAGHLCFLPYLSEKNMIASKENKDRKSKKISAKKK